MEEGSGIGGLLLTSVVLLEFVLLATDSPFFSFLNFFEEMWRGDIKHGTSLSTLKFEIEIMSTHNVSDAKRERRGR